MKIKVFEITETSRFVTQQCDRVTFSINYQIKLSPPQHHNTIHIHTNTNTIAKMQSDRSHTCFWKCECPSPISQSALY